MHFIKKIILDDKQEYQSSKIVDHTSKTINAALSLLDICLKAYVKDECGREAAENLKIIDIKKLDEVVEPMTDGILIYRLENSPYSIHIYQKKTTITKSANWTWGTKSILVSQFRRVAIFELEQYEKTVNSDGIPIAPLPNVDDEHVPFGPSKYKIPKKMTISPMCDVINELKNSTKFRSRFIDASDSNIIVINI